MEEQIKDRYNDSILHDVPTIEFDFETLASCL
jgi:hypothetical protein